MKVGDLVELESWCKNRHRPAIITKVIWFNRQVEIAYLDTAEKSTAMRDNLKVISSA
jgi:hypothetical protein